MAAKSKDKPEPQPVDNSANGHGPQVNGQAPRWPDEQFAKAFIANLDGICGSLISSRHDLFTSLFDRGHKIQEECGYPNILELSAEYWRELYDFDPIAARVCQLMPMESWQGAPSVFESKTSDTTSKFEQAWKDMVNGLTPASKSWHAEEEGALLWEYLMRADILSGIGQFGVILLGLDDGRNLQDPADGVEIVANTTINGIGCREFVPDCPPLTEEVENAKKDVEITTNAQTGPKGEWEVRPVRTVKGQKLPDERWFWDREKEACVASEIGWLIVNRQTGAVTDCPWNRKLVGDWKIHQAMTENKVTKEPDPYLGRTSFSQPSMGSSGYPGDGPFVQGTDSQYSQGFGLGMPAPIGEIDGGPALSGTDQQYFGVQFGPSEAFADKPGKKSCKLLFLRCFDESLVQVVRYEWNIRNPRFGLPVMYRITLNDPRQPHSGVGLPLATVYVHWSRVIHVADNLHSSEIFGIPRLRPVLYSVLDARKIRAASPEGYWQSCFTALSLETHPQLGGDVIVDQPALQQMMQLFRERLQRFLTLSGMSAKTLAPSVTDPTPHIQVLLEAIGIKLGCPMRVLKGAERGELASSQDDEDWNERRRARQHTYVTPKLICPFVDRCIQLGILPEPEEGYYVEWPDIDAIGKKDKAAIALQNTQTIGQYISTNGQSLIPEMVFLTRILGWTEEEAQAAMDEVAKAQEEQEQQDQDVADEHNFIPEPPEGYQNDPSQFSDDSDGETGDNGQEGEQSGTSQSNSDETADSGEEDADAE